jgi:hypothetical protein
MTALVSRRGVVVGAASVLVGAALSRHVSTGPIAQRLSGGRITLWRLDTAASGTPCRCKACTAHADNKIFTSRQAALDGRAHVGCRCEPVPVSATDAASALLLAHSRDGGRSVDLRRVSAADNNGGIALPVLDPEL